MGARHLGQAQGGGAGGLQVAGSGRAFRNASQCLAQRFDHVVSAQGEGFLHVRHRSRFIPTRRGQFGTQAEKFGPRLRGAAREGVGHDGSGCGRVPGRCERGGQLAQGFDVARGGFHGLAQAGELIGYPGHGRPAGGRQRDLEPGLVFQWKNPGLDAG